MKLVEYQLIIKHIEEQTGKCNRSILWDILAKFPLVGSYDTLLSVFLNHVQRHVKISFNCRMKGDAPNLYYQLYKEMTQEQSPIKTQPPVLVSLSNRFQIPPGLMARLIIEQFLHDELRSGRLPTTRAQTLNTQKDSGSNMTNALVSQNANQIAVAGAATDDERVKTFPVKQTVSSWMKDPSLITDNVLREQVLQCISYDVCYGSINDAIRHSVGLEFEIKLRDFVTDLKLPFLDENDLRKRGYDKTPDIKLEIPIAVQGHPVCWIESKASFGDLETHGEYLRGQYLSYWNRFGPGLVIYWFGFIDEISDEMKKQGILTMDKFPSLDDIIVMNP